MSAIIAKIKQEPAMVGTIVTVLIGLGMAFGLHLSEAQQGSISAAVAIIVGLFIRQNVTPIKAATAAPTVVNTPNPV